MSAQIREYSPTTGCWDGILESKGATVRLGNNNSDPGRITMSGNAKRILPP